METLKYIVLMLTLIAITGLVALAATAAKPEPAPAKPAYDAVWSWCGNRFPYREDLQEACRWGAYEMLPGADVPAEEGVQNA